MFMLAKTQILKDVFTCRLNPLYTTPSEAISVHSFVLNRREIAQPIPIVVKACLQPAKTAALCSFKLSPVWLQEIISPVHGKSNVIMPTDKMRPKLDD